MVQVMHDRAARNLAALETHFAQGHVWLAGDTFTVADIMIMFPPDDDAGIRSAGPVALSKPSRLSEAGDGAARLSGREGEELILNC
jgi:glutathione S-transferase